MAKNVLSVNKIVKRYPNFLLNQISLNLEEGTITGFIGKNGAGKSTTLKAIMGLIKIESGTIKFDMHKVENTYPIQCVVFKQNLYEVIKGNLIPIIIFLLYYSLYIMLGYCFGYLIAQNTIYVCMVTAGILALAYEKLSLNIDFALLANKHSIIVLSIVSIGIIFFFFLFACKGCEKREN